MPRTTTTSCGSRSSSAVLEAAMHTALPGQQVQRRAAGAAHLAQQGDLLPGTWADAHIGGRGHQVQLVTVQARPVLLVLRAQVLGFRV